MTTPPNNLHLKKQQRNDVRENTLSYYQGIIPSPEMMEGYQKIDPLLPMTLVQMTKDESEHRRDIERKLVKGSIASDKLGLILAFLTVPIICTVVIFFMLHGYPTQGATVAVGVIVGLAGVFIIRSYRNKKDDDK